MAVLERPNLAQLQTAPSSAEVEAALIRAQTLLDNSHWREAHDCLLPVLSEAPDCAEANYLLAVAANRLERFEEASDYLELAVHYRPEHAPSWLELAGIYERCGRFQEATEALQQAVRIDPELQAAQRRLGLMHVKSGRLDAAELCFRRAAELCPSDAYALSDLGYVLFHGRREVEAATAILQAALRIDPTCVDAHVNLGAIGQHCGRWVDALAHYEEALKIDPGTHDARLGRGLVRLLHGDFLRGWRDYEARKSGPMVPGMRLALRSWRGEPLAEKSVLLYGEQGLGDELMFASCIPALEKIARPLALFCAPRLEPLFRRSFPRVHVCSGEQLGNDIETLRLAWRPDFKMPLGSLPLLFRPDQASFPLHTGYLKADPERVSRWRSRLSKFGAGLKVGISWRGGTHKTRRNARSMALEQLATGLCGREVELFSLQYGDCSQEISRLRQQHGIEVTHFPESEDYEELAALVDALDVVVSVCTAVVHLAGALGKQAWVLVPAVPEWRYMLQTERMPWYPSVRLVRQSTPGDWSPVIAEISRRLRFVAHA